MNLVSEHTATDAIIRTAPDADVCVTRPIIVVGSGPVGARFVHDLLNRQPGAHVILIGNEPYSPYNRIQLAAVLMGDVDESNISLTLPDNSQHPNFSYRVNTVTAINRSEKTVCLSDGCKISYAQLVLSVGARAHLPDIPGVDMKGIYTFRNMKDTVHLSARLAAARRILIVGGGLLGLEAARALSQLNTHVTLIQQGPTLMNRQLHPEAAVCLQRKIEALGIIVKTEVGVRAINGDDCVSGVTLRDGSVLECDTVVLCAGITPNVELARSAGLAVGRGIVVNESLQTADPDIFALGECCEFDGTTYGLVAPGLEQAAVVSGVICGDETRYRGSLAATRLKVVDAFVSSMGQINELRPKPQQYELTWASPKNEQYRKIVVHKGRIIGACCLGEWSEHSRILESFRRQRQVFFWQRWWFSLSGKLWFSGQSDNLISWPDNAVVCQCQSVDKGTLIKAVGQGCASIVELQSATGAGTVCGSCKPMLAQLAGNKTDTRETGTHFLLLMSILAVLVAVLIMTVPEAQKAVSVQSVSWFEGIWADKFAKQVTGFTLMGLTTFGLMLSFRKRLDWQWMGQFSYWRLLHSGLGLVCISTLILHTGFHLGANLNQALMINFLSIVVLGAVAGLSIALSHRLQPCRVQSVRRFWSFAHILVAWPLPILLGLHVLSVYYF
ncbi:Nitrite reductase [NAD(P)H] [BD1-7 clade bacterium]|uniref:Nitrite reductase [NAD(P)H] n=1 Tax=BD1-7 clade bacterium TaxID=2029982 RepID=A0A5S9QRQ8_9GAMM|nr:Nitrite reductase [NAD(P)H] [BD1-7 clade bacterium]